ncbi:MAG TPA: AGE family epimerase/isomerase, partial [Polyangiaceae bacterium]
MTRKLGAYALILALVAACTRRAPVPTVPAANSAGTLRTATAAAARVQALRARLDALARSEFEFWATHGPDPKYGGFYGTLDRAGQPITPSNKGLIQQARQLWTFSMWFEKKQRTPDVRRIAENQYHFLIEHFYEPQSHEFVFTVSESGAPVDPKKVLYAEAFAIYGLSEYARVFHVPDAARYALECFKSLDARAHDAQYGGYDQTHDPA